MLAHLRRIVMSLADRRMVSRDAPHQRTIVVVATVVVFLGAFLSARSLELDVSTLRWSVLAVTTLLGFLIIPLNALEYRYSARLVDRDVDFVSAVPTTVIASPFNVLPLPAGALVRSQGLREGGASGKSAALATGATGSIWLATSAASACAVLAATGQLLLGLVFLAVFAAATTLTLLLVRGRQVTPSWLGSIVLIELSFVALAAVRFYLVVSALGVTISGVQSVVVATSSSLASATGVLPGSVGVFEFIAAGLAAATDLPASSGFLGTALLRVMAAISSGIAGLVLTRGRLHPRPTGPLPSPHRSPDS